MSTKTLILASQSPRRIKLLKDLGLKFKVQPSDVIELAEHKRPRELAKINASRKARDILKKFRANKSSKPSIIIGADTIGAANDQILLKPRNKAHAKEMLQAISGQKHQVITALCLIDTKSGRQIVRTRTTQVHIEKLDDQTIDAYIASGEGADKAAGYAIQGKGSLFITKIVGDYFNVVGLPINLLKNMLQEFGLRVDKIA